MSDRDPNLLPHPIVINLSTGAVRKASPAEVRKYEKEWARRKIYTAGPLPPGYTRVDYGQVKIIRK